MSPERTKVFVVEDDEMWQVVIRRFLERAGHEVVLSATTLGEALEKIEQLEEHDVQAVTLDGNLNKNDTSGADGQKILKAIRKQAPGVKVVGMSGLGVPGADVNLGKLFPEKLGSIVTEL